MCCSVAGCSSSGGKVHHDDRGWTQFRTDARAQTFAGQARIQGHDSYPETQRMLDQALGDVKRLRIEDKLTQKAAADAPRVIGELYHRD